MVEEGSSLMKGGLFWVTSGSPWAWLLLPDGQGRVGGVSGPLGQATRQSLGFRSRGLRAAPGEGLEAETAPGSAWGPAQTLPCQELPSWGLRVLSWAGVRVQRHLHDERWADGIFLPSRHLLVWA